MILLHEVHQVIGAREEAFEAAFRDGFLAALGDDGDARLLYFLHHAHGTGVSYNVVTLTALRDAAAWESLARRIHAGDLTDWARNVDDLRHDVRAKLLTPLPWSPLQEIELGSISTDSADHEPSVFMEDTVWPYEGQLEEYVERSGAHYAVEMRENAAKGGSILEVLASYRTLFGSGLRREILLWQKVVQPKALTPLVSREVPEQYKRPGTWMHDGLGVRDRWESKLLRTARWSPWH